MNIGRYFLPLALLSLLFVGGFSLSRIDSRLELGVLGQVRYWVACALVVVVFCRFVTDDRLPRDRSFWIWLFLVVGLHGLVALSVLWSPTPPVEGLADALDLGLLIGILLMAVVIFGTSAEMGVNVLSRSLLWMALILVVAAAVVQGGLAGDISPWGAGSIGVSRIQGVAIIAAVYLWKKTKQPYWTLIPVILASMFLSESRSAVLGVGVAALLVMFANTSVVGGMRALLVLGATTATMFAVGPGRDAAVTFWYTVWAGGQLYMSGRDRLFSDAWDLFLQRPLWGVGHGGYYSEHAESTYPHNLVLSVAVDTGIIGLLTLAAVLLLLIVRWFRPRTLEHTVAAIVGVFSFVGCMFAGTYYDARFMWLFFLLYMLPARSPGVAVSRRDSHAKVVANSRQHAARTRGLSPIRT